MDWKAIPQGPVASRAEPPASRRSGARTAATCRGLQGGDFTGKTEGLKKHMKHEETEIGPQHTSNDSDPTKFPDLIWWDSSKNIIRGWSNRGKIVNLASKQSTNWTFKQETLGLEQLMAVEGMPPPKWKNLAIPMALNKQREDWINQNSMSKPTNSGELPACTKEIRRIWRKWSRDLTWFHQNCSDRFCFQNMHTVT